MVYRSQSVDGVLDVQGGASLAQERSRIVRERGPLEPGDATMTPATGRLRETCRFVVHAVAPYYSSHSTWTVQLERAYAAALDLSLSSSSSSSPSSAALPLLGAGARGAPVDEAAAVAARALVSFCRRRRRSTSSSVLRFGCIDEEVARTLCEAIDATLLGAFPATATMEEQDAEDA